MDLIERYSYKDPEVANKLHAMYSGREMQHTLDHFSEQFKQLQKLFPNKTEKKLCSHIRHWQRTMDPSTRFATVLASAVPTSELTYQEIHEMYKKSSEIKPVMDIVKQMTIPGSMASTIEYAKANKHKKFPEAGIHSFNIRTYANPMDIMFNPTFAKDLVALVPHWCKKSISESEGEKLLQLFVKKHGRWPTSRKDQWVLPTNHPLAQLQKLGYKIEPNLFYYMKKHKPDQLLVLAEMQLEKGIMPEGTILSKLAYNQPKKLEKLKEKYQDVFLKANYQSVKKEIATSSLAEIKKTPSAVGKFDMELLTTWEKIEHITDKWRFNDVDSYVTKVDGHTRMVVGNSLKFINAKYKFNNNKIILAEVDRIRNKIKKKIPAIVKIYTDRKKLSSKEARDYVYKIKYDNVAKEVFAKILKHMKQGVEYRHIDKKIKLSYLRQLKARPNLAIDIKKANPDWVNLKWIAQQIKLLAKEKARKKREEKRKKRMKEKGNAKKK